MDTQVNYENKDEQVSDIAIPNRLAEIENEMHSVVNNYIVQFIEPDQWYKVHQEEADYLRNTNNEVKVKIGKEFKKSSNQIIYKYVKNFERDSLSENKLDFKNFESIWRNFQSDIEKLLVEIINSNR